MANILATVTADARKYWPQFFGTLLGICNDPVNFYTSANHWNPLIKYFRVGEGGWIGSNTVPRVPQPDLRRLQSVTGYDSSQYFLQDLDCVIDRQRALIDQRYPQAQRGWFEKVLDPVNDLKWDPLSPTGIQVRCLLDFTEFNDNHSSGSPTSPNVCELALYSDHPKVACGSNAAVNNTIATYDTLFPDNRLMIAYGTFPVEVKDSSKQIEHLVQIVF